MKKLYFLISLCLMASVLTAQVSKTVTATAGNLRTAFTTAERTTVTNLTVTGTIDARDFKFMRDTLNVLSVVDLSTVTIASYTGTAGTYSTSYTAYLANGIPQSAFSNNISLKTITLPTSITTIGASAFYYCGYLTGSLTIPNSVTTIGTNAFCNCSGIKTLIIGSDVTSIGDQAFYYCSGIKVINSLNTTPSTITNYTFYNVSPSTVYVPASAVTAYKAATGWSSLPISGPGIAVSASSITGLNYAPGATTPYQSSFTLSGGMLTDNVVITAPTNFEISTTSGAAFVAASNITLSSVGGALALDTIYLRLKTGLSLNAYTGNVNVSSTGVTSKTIALAGTVRAVPEKINVSMAGTLGSFFAISERSIVTKLTVTGTIDARDFKFMRDTLSMLSVLDLSAASIQTYTGSLGTYSTSSTTYPTNEIPQYAFFIQNFGRGKTSLKTITLPTSITSIGAYAFYYCSGLGGELTLGSSVTSVGSNAFSQCNFSIINSLNPTPPTLASSDFNNYNGVLIYVPASSVATYKAASIWSSYTIIVEKKVIINNPTPGSLANALITGGYGPLSSITQLTITGNLNSDDISQINTNMTVLSVLDLSGATLANNTLPANAFQKNYSNNTTILSSVILPATLVTIGASAFYSCSGLTSIIIPNSVTSIGASAFSDCSGLTSITIPNSVTSIGDMAFYNCKGLTSITIPNSVTSIGAQAFYNTPWYNSLPDGLVYVGKIAYAYKGTMPTNTTITLKDGTIEISGSAFSNFTGLTSITIPNTVTSIGDGAFYGCTGLSSITIPPSVLLVGSHFNNNGSNNGVFAGCTSLTSVTLSEGTTLIGNNAFSGCTGLSAIPIPVSVDTIGSQAFYGCTGLTNVVIPATIKYVGNGAFRNCTGITSATTPFAIEYVYNGSYYSQNQIFDSGNAKLTTFTIPEGVKSIKPNAFSGFSKITSVSLPSTVDSISINAFNGCTGLTSIKIPTGVLAIGDGAFSDCTGLTSITIPSSVHLIGSFGNNNNNSYGSGVFSNCTGLSSVTIGENVTYIGNSAFSGCTGLSSITIPSSVTTIGNSAFQGCTGFSSIAIPSKVISIGYGSFQSCTGLKSITLSADTIGYSAFSDCTVLSSVTLSEGVKEIENGVFQNCGKITTISFPSTLTNLGSEVFSNCYGLSDIAARGVKPAQCFSTTFDGMNTNTCTLRVPAGGASVYKYETGWSDFYLNTVEDVTINTSDQKAKAFSVVAQNGQVVINGDIAGEMVSLYNIRGLVLCHQQANASSVTMPLPENGVYVVRVGSQTVKVAY